MKIEDPAVVAEVVIGAVVFVLLIGVIVLLGVSG